MSNEAFEISRKHTIVLSDGFYKITVYNDHDGGDLSVGGYEVSIKWDNIDNLIDLLLKGREEYKCLN